MIITLITVTVHNYIRNKMMTTDHYQQHCVYPAVLVWKQVVTSCVSSSEHDVHYAAETDVVYVRIGVLVVTSA